VPEKLSEIKTTGFSPFHPSSLNLHPFPQEIGAFCKNACVLHELWRFQANFASCLSAIGALLRAQHLCFMNYNLL
jgi:hypothetical protein